LVINRRWIAEKNESFFVDIRLVFIFSCLIKKERIKMTGRWEYLFVNTTLRGIVVTVGDVEVKNKTKIKNQLDTLGREGWECFSAMVLPAEANDDRNQRIQYSLKRPC
jgi:hypothetical protein